MVQDLSRVGRRVCRRGQRQTSIPRGDECTASNGQRRTRARAPTLSEPQRRTEAFSTTAQPISILGHDHVYSRLLETL